MTCLFLIISKSNIYINHLMLNKYIFFVIIILCFTPFFSPPLALLAGIAFSIILKNPFQKNTKKATSYLLQSSIVCLGFGMNLFKSLQTGKEGIFFTIITVFGVLALGIVVGKILKVESKLTYLISVGTSICGGSAIAAISPIIKADNQEISISIGTVFILNALALLIFPFIGNYFNLTQHQFGLWAAIAIHDTSSVVGAASVYGKEALEIATIVKLTRALWIIPLAVISTFIFKNNSNKIYIPWFILFYILAMLSNTFISIPIQFSELMVFLGKKGLTVSLFLIGSGISTEMLKKVGFKPFLLGVILWFVISLVSLIVII